MESTPSLDQLAHRAITFPGPYLRLTGLKTSLTAIEDQLKHLRDQYEVRMKADLKRNARSLHPDDVEIRKDEFTETVDQLFPKIFRGGFLISLWSVFEACVKDMAEYTREKRGFPFGLEDLRAGDFLGQMEKFFQGTVNLRAFPDRVVRTKLDELRGFRNALTHHNGSTDALPKALRAKNKMQYQAIGLQVYRDLHHEYAIPNADYLQRSLSVVDDYLEELATRLYASLHPENARATDA